MQWRERDGVRWLEARLERDHGPGAVAAFSARGGGFSEPPYDGLNLGILSGDLPDRVRRNRRALTAALGREDAGILFGHQVHGAGLRAADEAPDPNPWLADLRPSESDAQATANPRLTPLVQVADCLPIALAGPGGVAIVHGGWRGLAAGIVAAGVRATVAEVAAIGPGIGPCCYEVGDRVRSRFEDLGPGVADGRMLDLPEVARRLLVSAGVGRVEASGLCTSCERDLFFSHRRDGERTGRQAGLVWLEEASGG